MLCCEQIQEKSYEYGHLVIACSETHIEVSPVLQREKINDELWFPSLTNMMLAIAESIEIIGTIFPGFTCDENGYLPDEDEEREQWKTWTAIAKKYGSPRGQIIIN